MEGINNDVARLRSNGVLSLLRNCIDSCLEVKREACIEDEYHDWDLSGNSLWYRPDVSTMVHSLLHRHNLCNVVHSCPTGISKGSKKSKLLDTVLVNHPSNEQTGQFGPF
jgi:hypothetical protein